MKKILFIAMTESIHTARWIKQIAGAEYELHLYPATTYSDSVHDDLKHIVVNYNRQREKLHFDEEGRQIYFDENGIQYFYNETGIKYYPGENGEKILLDESGNVIPEFKYPGAAFLHEFKHLVKKTVTKPPEPEPEKSDNDYLIELIEELKPDLIHTMETQHAAYQALEVKNRIGDRFPKWLHTIWGSDIYLFGRLKEHKDKISEVLANCDYYLCEGQRDIELAKKFGLKGKALEPMPVTGGFDIETLSALRQHGDSSDRKHIILKGYHGWAGRAMNGLRALERCADVLQGYEILMFLSSPDMYIPAELFEQNTSIPLKIIPIGIDEKELMEYYGKSRIFIGLSISDGLPRTLLEAMIMGALPIQSDTSLAADWVEHGKNGLLVPPEDTDIIEQNIRRALTDDVLVNNAAIHNFNTCSNKIDISVLNKKAEKIYKEILG